MCHYDGETLRRGEQSLLRLPHRVPVARGLDRCLESSVVGGQRRRAKGGESGAMDSPRTRSALEEIPLLKGETPVLWVRTGVARVVLCGC